MNNLITNRFILRPFTQEDWSDVQELAINWKNSPGPEFDKWPTDEQGSKNFTKNLSENEKYFAAINKDLNKVIGLIAINNIDKNKQVDLGHVIHSKYQDNDNDQEILKAIIEYIFKETEAQSIITHNDSNHIEQISPLKSLGFKNINKDNHDELVVLKEDW